jgi:dihydrofolate synthase/folylpolyglutamate synthase
MIAAILTAAGYRTGVFSSPHLERIEERFAVDGQACTAEELVNLVSRMLPVVRAMDEEAAAANDSDGGPTYFEITTAMALVHFVERQVDAAVLEVGLGGRLDSTNVCLPIVSVITSISFDHTKQLGNTLSAIAGEKAGIIKPGVPVVCGVVDAEPQAVIAGVAREHGCRVIQLGSDFGFQYQSPLDCGLRIADCGLNDPKSAVRNPQSEIGWMNFEATIAGEVQQLKNISLAMRGSHQAANAAVALATIGELRHQGWCISTEAMRMGLERATLPGRVEVFPGEPVVVLDAAHNSASARALVEALAEMPAASRRTVVLSVSYDKDVWAIVAALAHHFHRFVVTQYQENPRAVTADQLAKIIGQVLGESDHGITICSTPLEAWNHVLQTAIPGERVCITGSFYLAAEMRSLVRDYATSAAAGR